MKMECQKYIILEKLNFCLASLIRERFLAVELWRKYDSSIAFSCRCGDSSTTHVTILATVIGSIIFISSKRGTYIPVNLKIRYRRAISRNSNVYVFCNFKRASCWCQKNFQNMLSVKYGKRKSHLYIFYELIVLIFTTLLFHKLLALASLYAFRAFFVFSASPHFLSLVFCVK